MATAKPMRTCLAVASAASPAGRRMTMKSQSALVFGAAALLVGSGCGYSAPYRTSGVSLSDQGVQVGIAGVRCYVNRGSDPMIETTTDDDQVGLEVKLAIN